MRAVLNLLATIVTEYRKRTIGPKHTLQSYTFSCSRLHLSMGNACSYVFIKADRPQRHDRPR